MKKRHWTQTPEGKERMGKLVRERWAKKHANANSTGDPDLVLLEKIMREVFLLSDPGRRYLSSWLVAKVTQ